MWTVLTVVEVSAKGHTTQVSENGVKYKLLHSRKIKFNTYIPLHCLTAQTKIQENMYIGLMIIYVEYQSTLIIKRWLPWFHRKKNTLFQSTPLRKQKDKSRTQRTYLKIIYPICGLSYALSRNTGNLTPFCIVVGTVTFRTVTRKYRFIDWYDLAILLSKH